MLINELVRGIRKQSHKVDKHYLKKNLDNFPIMEGMLYVISKSNSTHSRNCTHTNSKWVDKKFSELLTPRTAKLSFSLSVFPLLCSQCHVAKALPQFILSFLYFSSLFTYFLPLSLFLLDFVLPNFWTSANQEFGYNSDYWYRLHSDISFKKSIRSMKTTLRFS